MFDRRLRILMIIGALYLLAIGVRLFDMQALNFGQWRLEAASLARRSIRLSARRGRILDRNGVPLAEDRIQNNLYLRLDREDDGSFVCTGCGKPVHTEHEKPPRRCRTCGSSEFDPGEQADWSKLPELLGLDPAKFRACGARAKKRYELAVKAEIKRRKKSWKRVKPADVRRVLLPREYLFFEKQLGEADVVSNRRLRKDVERTFGYDTCVTGLFQSIDEQVAQGSIVRDVD